MINDSGKVKALVKLLSEEKMTLTDPKKKNLSFELSEQYTEFDQESQKNLTDGHIKARTDKSEQADSIRN